MDTVSRLVRQRPSSATFGADKAHLIVVEDSLETVGGDRIFKEVFDRIRKTNSTESVLVCVDSPPSQATTAIAAGGREEEGTEIILPAPRIIDCFSDPCGELQEYNSTLYDTVPVFGEEDGSSSRLLDTLLDTILSSLQISDASVHGKAVIGIDDISHIVSHFGARRTRMFLDALRQHKATRCIVVGLHNDLLPPHDVATVSHDITCLIHLEPGWKLIMAATGSAASSRYDVSDAIGIMTLYIRKSQGCKKTETYEYWISDAHQVIYKVWKEPGSTATKDTISAPLGSMKLELSQQEQEAKTHVKLPYEHQGSTSSLYSTDDYRDYLPPQAGGHGPSSGPLGHILYVRDSDSEEPDSDEDPDDDLDI